MANSVNVCERPCNHVKTNDPTRLIVITGGPGAGKTAVLEMARKVFCEHVAILPESASIVFGGGFWRLESISAKRAAQGAKQEFKKYLALIHLRSPTDLLGYNQQNPLRIETAIQAGEIDDKIAEAWSGHPNYEIINSTEMFLIKAQTAMKLISKFLPNRCVESLKGVLI